VQVGYDADLFSGPAASPRWKPEYVAGDVVTPIAALWVDQGVVGYDRVADPARSAAEQFAAELEERGLRVIGEPSPTATTERDRVLARVHSPPLDQIVQAVLERSDNEGAEVLLRHVAAETGRPASFAGGAAAVRDVLTRLGVPWRGVAVHDGSGLSGADRVSLAALVAVLRLAVDPDHPELRTVVSDLPVAGFTGSLSERFDDPAAAQGRGVVRAKTGTLSRVHALAGMTLDRNGAALGFVVLVDRVRERDGLDARAQLDRIAAALAACSCSQ
jgi:D-alanyl-D-alanine carboxypeptidase/D-alanyl-D-alanine-endopeptidase (penicillin-binding protein 4)